MMEQDLDWILSQVSLCVIIKSRIQVVYDSVTLHTCILYIAWLCGKDYSETLTLENERIQTDISQFPLVCRTSEQIEEGIYL